MAEKTLVEWNDLGAAFLPGLLGFEVLEVERGRLQSQMQVTQRLLAANGYLHAASVVALADTSCGYGALASLPAGAENFTTIELKSNHVGTARTGTIACEAVMVHGGRSTQLWDATVTELSTGKVIAYFRCTQMILYPRP